MIKVSSTLINEFIHMTFRTTKYIINVNTLPLIFIYNKFSLYTGVHCHNVIIIKDPPKKLVCDSYVVHTATSNYVKLYV